jgi:hypothetical protein
VPIESQRTLENTGSSGGNLGSATRKVTLKTLAEIKANRRRAPPRRAALPFDARFATGGTDRAHTDHRRALQILNIAHGVAGAAEIPAYTTEDESH